jgi:hypothetical protein
MDTVKRIFSKIDPHIGKDSYSRWSDAFYDDYRNLFDKPAPSEKSAPLVDVEQGKKGHLWMETT